MADNDEIEPTPAQDVVVTKYKMTGDLVNGILKELLNGVKENASVKGLCELGDERLLHETSKVFKKEKEMKKGIAFPTCISINNCICHFSPLKSDEDVLMKKGDVVKIDLGAQLDGFIAVAAHTVVVGATSAEQATGRKADVVMAAHKAMEVALRLLKPGNENSAVTKGVQTVTEDFECKPIEGMMSHQLKRHVIDGEKAIIQNPGDRKIDTCEFEVHEVYGIDVLISTGEGKGRDLDQRVTVYKKKDFIYQLKMKASRQLVTEVEKKCGLMPFNLRICEDEKKARMGVVECVKHDLLESFNILFEKEGEYVAQFKQTVILMPNGPLRIAGLPFDASLYKSEKVVKNEEMTALLSQSISRKTATKKKKKASQAVAESLETPQGDGND